MAIYRPRHIPIERNAWQETGDQLLNIGGLITGNTRQRKADERQAMLDERDKERWDTQVGWREDEIARQESNTNFTRGVEGWHPINKNNDLMSDFQESASGLKEAEANPFDIVREDPSTELPGIGQFMRERAPTSEGYRYNEGTHVARQQQLADERRAQEAAIAAEGREEKRTEGDREFQRTLRQEPYWTPPPAPARPEFHGLDGVIFDPNDKSVTPIPGGPSRVRPEETREADSAAAFLIEQHAGDAQQALAALQGDNSREAQLAKAAIRRLMADRTQRKFLGIGGNSVDEAIAGFLSGAP